MSDRVRSAAGVILLAAAAVICLLILISLPGSREDRYRTDDRQWTLKPTEAESGGTVNVNTADAEELTELPGIGETLAGLITAEREANGPYYYAEDLEAVRGIGPRTLEKIRKMIDLSTDESGE